MKIAFHTPFEEQLAFFRQKLNLPTAHWDDLMKAAHDRAFIVAGAAQADLLADLKRAVDKTLSQGFGLAEFRRDFKQIVHNHGWSGWTGQGTQAGEAWRTKVIYQTNLMTSYAAGRYAQLTDPEFVKIAPYWRYVHDDSVRHPRPEHKAWGDAGLTLRYDDPFWETHFPPNGWGCMCRVTPVQAPATGAATEAPAGWDTRDADGNLPGVGKGFDYQPGASVADELRQIIADKRASLPEPLSKALAEDVAGTIAGMKTSTMTEIEQMPPDQAKRAIADTLASVEFNVFVSSHEKGTFPVGIANDAIKQALDTDVQVIRLSADDRDKQLGKDDEWGRRRYELLQRMIDRGWIVKYRNGAVSVFEQDGEWFHAAIRTTKARDELYLKSLRRSEEGQLNRDKKRGIVVQVQK